MQTARNWQKYLRFNYDQLRCATCLPSTNAEPCSCEKTVLERDLSTFSLGDFYFLNPDHLGGFDTVTATDRTVHNEPFQKKEVRMETFKAALSLAVGLVLGGAALKAAKIVWNVAQGDGRPQG